MKKAIAVDGATTSHGGIIDAKFHHLQAHYERHLA